MTRKLLIGSLIIMTVILVAMAPLKTMASTKTMGVAEVFGVKAFGFTPDLSLSQARTGKAIGCYVVEPQVLRSFGFEQARRGDIAHLAYLGHGRWKISLVSGRSLTTTTVQVEGLKGQEQGYNPSTSQQDFMMTPESSDSSGRMVGEKPPVEKSDGPPK